MNRALVAPIANAVLYEGYILYPYRPSVKNHQRWTFGGLYPEDFCALHSGESSSQQTECLIVGGPETSVEAVARFLHLTDRQVGAIDPLLAAWPADADPPFRPVESLQVGDSVIHAWQEAEEREVSLPLATLGSLLSSPRLESFRFPATRRTEPLIAPTGQVVGILIRDQKPVEGFVALTVTPIEEDLFRLSLRISNETPLNNAETLSRDAAVLSCLASTHAILGTEQGEFVSLTDPPTRWRHAVSECHNLGAWPVLVGSEGHTDMMLSSPIILSDYPWVAPESPGDFFDGSEIDEMLALRIMTLTDEEKDAMAGIDDRTRALLARTEALSLERMTGLHGTIRDLRIPPGADAHG
jgi:hydrogenase maturation protease